MITEKWSALLCINIWVRSRKKRRRSRSREKAEERRTEMDDRVKKGIARSSS